MKIKVVPITDIEPWDKNPRKIEPKDLTRLKKQIQDLGVYKPLICTRENGKYVVLGGNMRFHALKDLGYQEVSISIVDAKTEPMKLKYSLSDNDRAGYYVEIDLAELVLPNIEEIDLKDFKVDLAAPWLGLAMVVDRAGPDIDPNLEWKDMPEFVDTQKAVKTILVHFKEEDNVREFEKIVGQKIGEKTKYIWFPKLEKRNIKSLVIENES